MGIGALDHSGSVVPDPSVYDIDGFDNPATTVSGLHARGKRVICYIETGAWESYRPDAGSFPPAVLGRAMAGYPDERYTDIRSPAVVELVKARVKMCADKGFDAIEPDLDDTYAQNTGFPITRADNVAFNKTIADYAHSLGLAIGLKNGDDPAFAAAVEPFVDFALAEQCFEYDTCDSLAPFTRAGKAVMVVEYSVPASEFCPAANARNFNGLSLHENLDGQRRACR